MKRINLVLGLSVVAALSFTSCANPVEEPAGAGSSAKVEAPRYEADPELVAMLPQNLQDGGTLSVGVNPDVPPMKFTDAEGNITGLAPQLVQAAADLLGLDTEMELTDFDALIPGLESGRIDVVASIGDFKERQEKATFIDILNASTSILAAKSYQSDSVELSDLCGERIGYVKGTQQQGLLEDVSKGCVEDGKPEVQSTSYSDGGTSILAVTSGQADGTWIDTPPVLYNVSQNPETFKKIYTSPKPILYGTVFNKKDVKLQEAFRAALFKIVEKGDYAKLLEGYGVSDLALPDFPINGGGPANG
ncbi:ABC transporter substrate-binding protein [Paeniglutamicibacter psychrophenolicus]|uniref:ABC transporter substrate-binding protein n=1 Tax=Paeniglutamicibacter psychrophenolicus TaxID=257454 RepID=UPI002780D806|nr:ABC transporter substrate-binding protein [Paeniglutamicibacter psychrophenolicus]MDQ0093053.1 polar amino acid transport system substrate-binding protein [Paeniglutamicibacter psychrophenolicus]